MNVRELDGIELSTVVQPEAYCIDREGQLPLSAKILKNPEMRW